MQRIINRMVMAVVGVLFVAFQAQAAGTWEASSTIHPSSLGQDIYKVIVTDNGSNFTIDMLLEGAPTLGDNNTQYNVFIGSTNALPTNPTDIINSNLLFYMVTLKTYVSTLIDLSNPAQPVPTPISVAVSNPSPYYQLEWIISKTEVASIPFFMGATQSGGTFTDKTAVAAAPIPAVAWLLASGLLALIGLKRKVS